MRNIRTSYQRAVSDKLFKLGIFTFVDLLFQDTECHGLFDNIVVIRYISFVDTAMEKSRGIIVTTLLYH
jgi:hypothetical protein